MLPEELFYEISSTLSDAGRSDLTEQLKPYRAKSNDLTSKQAAEMLGVSSPNTVKSWLEGGRFPGAYQTPGGHWRFPRQDVLLAAKQIEELHRRNREEDVEPNECDDEESVPLL